MILAALLLITPVHAHDSIKSLDEFLEPRLPNELLIPEYPNFHEDLDDRSTEQQKLDESDTEFPRREFETDEEEKKLVSDAIEYAEKVLVLAMQNTENDSWFKTYFSIKFALGRSKVHWPDPGYTFVGCGKNTLAFAFVGGTHIYLCRKLLDHPKYKIPEIGQTIIHEAAHNDGYGNECDATRIEVNSMRASKEGVRYRNGYWQRCNIR